MNFYELSKKIQEESNPINPTQPPMIQPTTPDPSIKNTSAIVAKISRRLGEKFAKYRPLLIHLNKNQEALALFDELLNDVGSMQASTAKRIMK